MKDFSEFIQDMGLIDLPLHGATYTWTRGEDFLQASKIDKFLIFPEWNEFFGIVKQVALPRALFDHRSYPYRVVIELLILPTLPC